MKEKNIILVTGSAGLIGSESVKYFADLGFDVIGIDNNMRQVFFGEDASTEWNKNYLLSAYKKNYTYFDVDIREQSSIELIFEKYSSDISLIIHTNEYCSNH
ncbi:NAD-dependent epimerase/dehydratase family protein [Geminocystis sp. CENA526]|uniref:NAD-dependent epimerase/dehydratase family protein n=1 Tax=Geminocystis sp. CENA526 TaxID=1355871 RepID=UPI003D6F0DF9